MLTYLLSMIDSEEGRSKFENIYYKYKDFMFKVAISVTRNYHDAEEALQNALFTISQNILKVQTSDEIKLKSFLRVIVKNSSIDLVRKRERTSFISIDSLEIEDREISDYIENTDIKEEYIKKVLSMPNIYREVLVLNVIHSMTPSQIAKTLSIPVNTVNTRLRRGRKTLEVFLKEKYGKY